MSGASTFVSIVSVCFVASLAAASGADGRASHLPALASPDQETRQAAARAILRGREQEIASVEEILRQTLRDDTRRGTAKTAIVLLGDLRAEQSVPMLVEHLELEVFYKETKRPQPPEDLYPCVGALIKIGMPSVGHVVSRAATDDDAKVPRCAALVLKEVLGKNLGRVFIRERVAGTADPAQRERLGRLAETLEAL